MTFLVWYGIFTVFAWYQLQHCDNFKGTNQNFYHLLLAYSLFNLIFLCVGLYLGFKIIGWWFLLGSILVPVIMQSAVVVLENIMFGGHAAVKLSFAGLIMIPLSVCHITNWKWSLVYILALIVYFLPVFIETWNRVKNKKG